MLFVLDESGLDLGDTDISLLEDSFRKLSMLLNLVVTSDFPAYCWSDIWSVKCNSSDELHQLVFNQAGIDPEVTRQLAVEIDRLSYWDDDFDIDPEFEFTCGTHRIEFAPSTGFCMRMIEQGRRGVMVTTQQGTLQGVKDLFSPRQSKHTEVLYISAKTDWVSCIREWLKSSDCPVSQVERYSEDVFDNLVFADGIWSQVRHFEGDNRTIRRQLINNLAGLNDHLLTIRSHHVTNDRIILEMKIRADVVCSPDSPKTHKNNRAMKQREVETAFGKVDCEWHAKLEPHRNRIHFGLNRGKVFIGIFSGHLET
ncbi:hypothetical protein IWX64_002320 [Arthrobacter sp. CAN_A212]|uniref:hypothetical protein n=1 Tax=Arthrobacter sp. CAN_A212 TaxID=2787719 RepID=UPI0018CA3278